TGVKIGANTAYGGTKFYNSSDMATEIMSVGNGDNHVRVANYLFAQYVNTSDNVIGSGVTGVMVKASDNYLRTGNAAAITTFLNTNNGWIQNQYGSPQSANYDITGTGRLAKIKFYGEGGNSGVGNDSYAIYQEAGAWSHPYPDLAIGFHTGIKLGAHYSYNGIRFYNNSDFATQTMSVGDGDNNVRINYNIATVGDIVSNQNYGLGLVGLYASTRYQNVFAMGAAYRLAADGTSPGNLYGLAWTHSNVGGQSISNLGHQLLVMSNGGTTAAIGNGFWSSYGIDVGGNGTYNRFRTWTELTGSHGLYSGVNGAHFYPNDASYGSWRILGTRNGWGGLEFPSGAGNISLMIGQGGWGGMTTGMHANSYGWLWRFEHQTLYAARWVDSDNNSYYFDGHSTSLVTGDFYISHNGGILRIGHGGYGGDWCCGGYDWWGCQGWCSNIRLSVYGGAESLGWYGWSDGRFKKDVQTVSNALDLVKSMRGVFYNWTFEGTTPSYDDLIKATEKKEYNPKDIEAASGAPPGSRIGVIAQEIQEVLPQVVTKVEDKDTSGTVIGHHYSVNYNDLVPVLIEAIKEQQKQIEELKAKVFGVSSENNLTKIEEKLKQSTIPDKNSFMEFIQSIKNKSELDQHEKLKLEMLKTKLGIN
ncbi:MAG: tail fiber domain-containing protein, partial [Bacteroidia bacterium]